MTFFTFRMSDILKPRSDLDPATQTNPYPGKSGYAKTMHTEKFFVGVSLVNSALRNTVQNTVADS